MIGYIIAQSCVLHSCPYVLLNELINLCKAKLTQLLATLPTVMGMMFGTFYSYSWEIFFRCYLIRKLNHTCVILAQNCVRVFDTKYKIDIRPINLYIPSKIVLIYFSQPLNKCNCQIKSKQFCTYCDADIITEFV